MHRLATNQGKHSPRHPETPTKPVAAATPPLLPYFNKQRITVKPQIAPRILTVVVRLRFQLIALIGAAQANVLALLHIV